MKCYECNVDVVPQSYPEGECPDCGLTYILADDNWSMCDECGDPPASEELGGMCIDCYIDDDGK